MRAPMKYVRTTTTAIAMGGAQTNNCRHVATRCEAKECRDNHCPTCQREQRGYGTNEDIEVVRRKTQRLEQANVTSDDQVMKVTAHVTPKGTGKTLFRTHWSRPYLYFNGEEARERWENDHNREKSIHDRRALFEANYVS